MSVRHPGNCGSSFRDGDPGQIVLSELVLNLDEVSQDVSKDAVGISQCEGCVEDLIGLGPRCSRRSSCTRGCRACNGCEVAIV